MKKWMIILALAVAAAVQAETITGIVYVEKEIYWKIGKADKAGNMIAKANINKADNEKIAPLSGKMAEVTGELDPASKFPTFLPGVQIKEVE